MKSLSHNRNKRRPSLPHLVVAVAYDGLCLFEFGAVVEIFGLPRPEMGPNWYRFAVAAAEPGPLRALGSVRIVGDGGLELLERADTIIVTGWRDVLENPPVALVKALRTAHLRGARLVSICSGAFVLAATGVLSDRNATTHWRYADQLAQQYPDIRLNADVLYIDDEDVLTSAGSAAGIDLCLHIVRRDFGPEAANSIARRLVIPPHREGGQAQYVERAVAPAREGIRRAVVRPDAQATSYTSAGRPVSRHGSDESTDFLAAIQGSDRQHACRVVARRAPCASAVASRDNPSIY